MDDAVTTDVVAMQAYLEASMSPPLEEEEDDDIDPKDRRDLEVDFGEATSDD